MSGPQGPGQNPWQPPGQGHSDDSTQLGPAAGSPWQQPTPTQDATWHAPAYTPSEYQQPATPSYETGAQPTQYGQVPQYEQPQPTQYGQVPQYEQPQPTQYGQTSQFGGPPTQYGQPAQYGQAPQYGEAPPYGATGQFGQPGQYPQPYEQPKKRSGMIWGIVGGIAALIALVVVVLGFLVGPRFFVTTELDVNKANAGVQQILTDETNGYGAKNVKDVKCNGGNNPKVSKGGTFDCNVTIDGAQRKVTVTFQDNDGTYEVGRPTQ